MGEARDTHEGDILAGKTEGRTKLGRPRRKWEDKMDLGEVGCQVFN